MSTTIHLDGKKQAVAYSDDKGNPLILQEIIVKLIGKQNEDLRKNLKVALISIAELPEGFLKISHELRDKRELLDEVLGPKSVKTLHELLPKLSDYHDPLRIDVKLISEKYQGYIKSLAYIIQKYKDLAAKVAIDDTINFTERIAPFLNPTTGLQVDAVICLREVCSRHEYNAHILKQFLERYGDLPISRDGAPTTTIRKELTKYQDLIDLAEDAQILT